MNEPGYINYRALMERPALKDGLVQLRIVFLYLGEVDTIIHSPVKEYKKLWIKPGKTLYLGLNFI